MQSQYQRLPDSQWDVVKPSLPIQRKYCLWVITDAILYCLRVGSQWCNVPTEAFPKRELVYYYFRRWKKDGTLEKLNWDLNRLERKRLGKEDSPSLMTIDSQSVKMAPFVSRDNGVDRRITLGAILMPYF